MSESVLVVPTERLVPHFGGRNFHLIRDAAEEILLTIASNYTFMERPEAEQSPEYRQIIPYVVARHDDHWFALTRTAKQTEARLHHRVSLGIGGHVNPDAECHPDGVIVGGLEKELGEEVRIAAPYELHFIGILNDETTEVSRVHLGVVYELVAQTPQIEVLETEKMTGGWIARAELGAKRDAMETWSQVVWDQWISRRD